MLQRIDINHYVALFRQGDEAGFDFFFYHYYKALCLFAFTRTRNREAAEELASEAFIKTWRHHQQFTNEGGIRAYLYQVLRNDCIKYLQQQIIVSTKERQYLSASPPVPDSPAADAALLSAEVARMVQAAIGTLAPECRKVFTALFIEGKTITEAATELQLSRNTVKSQRRRGIELLRKQLLMWR